MRDVLFRVNAGRVVGLGHLQRCLSLATALRRSGTESIFVTNRDPAAQLWIKSFGFAGRMISAAGSWSAQDCGETVAIGRQERCGVVVVDADDEGAEYLAQLRRCGFYVSAIEDLAPHAFPCHLVINGNAHARQLRYESAQDTNFLLGTDYAMLREEFWELPPPPPPRAIPHLLVMLGGDDPHQLMPRIIRAVGELSVPVTVTAVVGPFFSHKDKVAHAAARASSVVTIADAPTSVRDLMLNADMAISAGGQTLYELARVGCPSVAIETAANQAEQMRALHEAGVIHAVGQAEDLQIVETALTTIKSLMLDGPARKRVSAAGRQLIDGQGALRVAQVMSGFLRSRPGRPLYSQAS